MNLTNARRIVALGGLVCLLAAATTLESDVPVRGAREDPPLRLSAFALSAFARSATAKPRPSSECGVWAEAVSQTTPSGGAYGVDRAVAAQNQEPTARSWQVTASRYKFDPPRIEAFQDDLIRVELRTEDIAHSLTIDSYRIAKRVSPGQPITFEFRADQPGTFPYYCNLQIDDGCRRMRGELVVKPRR